MTATVRRSGLFRGSRAHPAGTTPASDESYGAESDEAYAADRRARLRRGRVAGFAVAVPLWIVSIVPLVRELLDGREGVRLVLVYLAVGAVSLGVAVVVRGVYVRLMQRRFWSPWLFPLAAFVAIVGYAVQSAGEEEVPLAGARASAWSAEATAVPPTNEKLTPVRPAA